MGVHHTLEINMIISEDLNPEYVKKICKYVFCNMQIRITLLVPNGKTKIEASRTDESLKEKVIVKRGNMAYAEIFKTVKEKVDIDRVGVKIKTMTKSMVRDLVLEIDGNKQKADALKEEISRSAKSNSQIT